MCFGVGWASPVRGVFPHSSVLLNRMRVIGPCQKRSLFFLLSKKRYMRYVAIWKIGQRTPNWNLDLKVDTHSLLSRR